VSHSRAPGCSREADRCRCRTGKDRQQGGAGCTAHWSAHRAAHPRVSAFTSSALNCTQRVHARRGQLPPVCQQRETGLREVDRCGVVAGVGDRHAKNDFPVGLWLFGVTTAWGRGRRVSARHEHTHTDTRAHLRLLCVATAWGRGRRVAPRHERDSVASGRGLLARGPTTRLRVRACQSTY
jgi:hypothetical protein